jgi:hypothetical protein
LIAEVTEEEFGIACHPGMCANCFTYRHAYPQIKNAHLQNWH